MNQSALNRAIARQTGESVRCIRKMGFVLVVIPPLALPSDDLCQAQEEDALNQRSDLIAAQNPELQQKGEAA
jgi:hypothetical protein